MKRIFFTALSVLILAGLFAIPALAGGWAVITLDELPGQVVAGDPLTIGFMVRQHGKTPMSDLTPTITAQLGTGKPILVNATAQGEVGHYVATLTLPEAGKWNWSIQAFTMEQKLPPLTVVASAAPVIKNETAPVSKPILDPSLLLLVSAGFAGVVVGLFVMRSGKRWAIALVAAGVILGAYGVVSAAAQPKVEAETTPVSAAPVSAESEAELGRQLFIAKGCITCHVHSDIQNYQTISFDDTPNLTNYTAAPEFLRMWLKDPRSVKPGTAMPTLGLSDAEIEALIAFLNEN